MKNSQKILGAALVLTLAACAPTAVTPPPQTVGPSPAPALIIPPRPIPPSNAALTQILPSRGIDGQFVTANSNISGDRAFWQVKIALNVAAIGCRGTEEATLISAYNKIIKTHGKAIKASEKTVITQLGKEHGNNGIAPRDRLSTQLFNYFAQPPAQREFCVKANEVAQLVSAAPAAQVVSVATTNLPILDKPFIDFYEAYARYQADVQDWDTKYSQYLNGASTATPPPAPTASAPSSSPAGGA